MSKGVVVVASWKVKPERLTDTVEMLRRMFPETRLQAGFRNIRLLAADNDPHTVVLIEEWDEAQNFHDYIKFRTETGEMAILTEMSDGNPMQLGIWASAPLGEAQA